MSNIQVILLDPPEPPRITCSANVLFPKAPDGVKLTLTKRYGEFMFGPNMTVSEWIDAGKLDLQVRSPKNKKTKVVFCSGLVLLAGELKGFKVGFPD